MDLNRDGVVSFDEFMETCKNDENITRAMISMWYDWCGRRDIEISREIDGRPNDDGLFYVRRVKTDFHDCYSTSIVSFE